MFGLSSLYASTAGIAATGSAIIGLYIGYQAYRSLRRNEDRAMQYLSVGMILVFGVTYALAMLGQGLISFEVVGIRYQSAFRALVRVLQFLGLGLIAYSLRVATTDGRPTR